MLGGLGIHEFMLLMLIIMMLTMTGMWPSIIRGLRELRGERVEPMSPPAGHGSPNIDICYKMFGISPSAPWEEVERAYRSKAKLHHPDHGGDGDAMRALNDAYRMIKQSRGRG